MDSTKRGRGRRRKRGRGMPSFTDNTILPPHSASTIPPNTSRLTPHISLAGPTPSHDKGLEHVGLDDTSRHPAFTIPPRRIRSTRHISSADPQTSHNLRSGHVGPDDTFRHSVSPISPNTMRPTPHISSTCAPSDGTKRGRGRGRKRGRGRGRGMPSFTDNTTSPPHSAATISPDTTRPTPTLHKIGSGHVGPDDTSRNSVSPISPHTMRPTPHISSDCPLSDGTKRGRGRGMPSFTDNTTLMRHSASTIPPHARHTPHISLVDPLRDVELEHVGLDDTSTHSASTIPPHTIRPTQHISSADPPSSHNIGSERVGPDDTSRHSASPISPHTMRPTPHISSASPPSSHNVGSGHVSPVDTSRHGEAPVEVIPRAGKIFLTPEGPLSNAGFVPSKLAMSCITKIIKKRLDKPYKYWQQVPEDVRDTWLREWKKQVTWDPQHEVHMRRAFARKTAKRMQDLYVECRETGVRPVWIEERVWQQLWEYWRSPMFKLKSTRGKKARNLEKGRSLHTGGSISFGTHAQRLARELQREPTHLEIFARTHQRKANKEWVDERAQEAYENFQQQWTQSQTTQFEGGEEEPTHTQQSQIKAWQHVVGKNSKGLSYGATYHHDHDSTACPAPPEHNSNAESSHSVENLWRRLEDESATNKKMFSAIMEKMDQILMQSGTSLPRMPPSPPPITQPQPQLQPTAGHAPSLDDVYYEGRGRRQKLELNREETSEEDSCEWRRKRKRKSRQNARVQSRASSSRGWARTRHLNR